MIIWVLDSNSGIKLLYKSFLKTDTDEDIVSGFLTAFHHFSMEEFKQALESIEMGGLKWIYILEPEFSLLFVVADIKDVKTEILTGRLNVIKKAFIKEFKSLWENRNKSWADGDINVFLPFLDVIEDYYNQWEQVENLADVADILNILSVFEHILILIRRIIEDKMYSKSRNNILNRITREYEKIQNSDKSKNIIKPEDITYSKEEWFDFAEMRLIKYDKKWIIYHLKAIVIMIVKVLKNVKGKDLCLKYFNEGEIYSYISANIKLLRDINLDKFLLDLFLLI